MLGVKLPNGMKPSNLDPRKIDVKKLAQQVERLAERVENTSEDVRIVSAQAKRVTKKLS